MKLEKILLFTLILLLFSCKKESPKKTVVKDCALEEVTLKVEYVTGRLDTIKINMPVNSKLAVVTDDGSYWLNCYFKNESCVPKVQEKGNGYVMYQNRFFRGTSHFYFKIPAIINYEKI